MAREDERLNRHVLGDHERGSIRPSTPTRLQAAPLVLGTWRIPESEVGALGDLAGLDVLERLRWRAVVDRARCGSVCG